jgi:hypothetical protein
MDSTFITAMPVAAISGLEVYNKRAEKWYHPKLQLIVIGKPYDCPVATIWALTQKLPGELLQLASHDGVQAMVHQVVATSGNNDGHLSAPILL